MKNTHCKTIQNLITSMRDVLPYPIDFPLLHRQSSTSSALTEYYSNQAKNKYYRFNFQKYIILYGIIDKFVKHQNTEYIIIINQLFMRLNIMPCNDIVQEIHSYLNYDSENINLGVLYNDPKYHEIINNDVLNNINTHKYTKLGLMILNAINFSDQRKTKRFIENTRSMDIVHDDTHCMLSYKEYFKILFRGLEMQNYVLLYNIVETYI